jgi:hypothetical protein
MGKLGTPVGTVVVRREAEGLEKAPEANIIVAEHAHVNHPGRDAIIRRDVGHCRVAGEQHGHHLAPGLAIKNPPKKTHPKKLTQKTHLKNPLKMGLLGF